MASTVNAAIAGLLSLLEASADLTGVAIHDGPPMTAETSEWIAVGYQPGQTEAVTIDWDWAQIGAQRSEEKYDVLCCLASRSGDTAMAAGRTRAIALRDAVAAAISTDRTLDGAVRLAHMSSGVLHQEQTAKGRAVGFTFAVSVTARITT